jgi:hypothetical protein
MMQKTSRSDVAVRPEPSGEPHDALGGGKLWVGQHAGDKDILVLDPAESDPTADVLVLYSLTHHRTRRFPRATVLSRISEVTDKKAHAQALKEYARRDSLRGDHERTLEAERAARMDSLRAGMVAAHEQFIAALGLPYQGVNKTATPSRSGRLTKCHMCGLDLDDFVGVSCGICSAVLCSCGACACGKPPRASRAKPAAATATGGEA